MTTATVIFQLDQESAQIYQRASEAKRERLRQLVDSWLRESENLQDSDIVTSEISWQRYVDESRSIFQIFGSVPVGEKPFDIDAMDDVISDKLGDEYAEEIAHAKATVR